MRKKLSDWLRPVVYLSNNWLSLAGVLLVTTATIFWLFLLPSTWGTEAEHPYLGILSFLLLPSAFFAGLMLIPAGVGMRIRAERHHKTMPDEPPPLDFRNPALRRILVFVAVTTFANIVIASQLTYRAVTYMDSVTFCGQTCHTVMKPEFAAYQESPHSRVECVKCHIGPGASWFVRSKMSGIAQVFAVTLNTYERPIPTPVANLRPARETCETCHWPQKYGADRVRVLDKFSDDENNTRSKTVLLMRIGGGGGGLGIHGAHQGPGILIRYRAADAKRQNIPWVEYTKNGTRRTYLAADAEGGSLDALETRVMDCMDCHNRPSHAFESPETALDKALAAGSVPPSLPFAKKKGLELLRQAYASNEEAEAKIPALWSGYYKKEHPETYSRQKGVIERAGQALAAIHNRNVFPEMKVNWGTYPNNISHMDFPGCFRCHDERASNTGDKTITQDCNTCHQLLAMEEPDPKILADLGITGN